MAETRTMILSTAAEAAKADHVDLRRDVLNGCPWHDVKSMLRDVGLRPTRQRMALGWILFAKGDRHLTAEMRLRSPSSSAHGRPLFHLLFAFST